MSAEGTVAGVVAAAGVACVAVVLQQVTVVGAAVVILSSVVANLVESVVGAQFQGSVKWLTNDVVNVIQISVAAALAVGGTVMMTMAVA